MRAWAETSRSPSTASTTSCATSTAGRSRSRSRTRRSTSRAAARSRPGTSASTTTTTTRTSPSPATCAARQLLDGYWERVAAARQGRLARTAPRFAQIICVADTDEEAEELYAEHVLLLLQPLPARLPRLRRPARLPHHQDASRPACSTSSREDRCELFPTLTWKDLVDGGYVIAGSPETVRRADGGDDQGRCASATSSACFTTATCRTGRRAHSTKLFAEQVMPQLRNMWPEYDGRRPVVVQAAGRPACADETRRMPPRGRACRQ